MATRDQLIQGLRAADAAGNQQDAQSFADAIKSMDAQTSPAAAPSGDQGAVVMRRPTQQPAAAPAPAQPAPAKPAAAAPAQPRSWFGALGEGLLNLPKSTYDMVANIGSSVAHGVKDVVDDPTGVATKISDTAGGAALALLPKGAQDWLESHASNPAVIKNAIDGATNMGAGIKHYYAQRYGSADAIKNTIAEDPAGALVDLSTLFTGGEGAARGVAAGAKAAGAADLAAGAAKVADVAGQGAHAANPLSAIMAPSKALGAAADAASDVPVLGTTLKVASKVAAAPVAVPKAIGRGIFSTVGGFQSLLTGAAGTDRAAAILREAIPADQMPLVQAAIAVAPKEAPLTDTLIKAGVKAPVLQAIGDAIERGPGGPEFGPVRDAQKDAVDAEVASREKTNADVTDAAAQENERQVGTLQAQHEQDLADLHEQQTQELTGVEGKGQDVKDALARRHGRQQTAMQANHDLAVATATGDNAAQLDAFQRARQSMVDELTDQANTARAEMAGGDNATAAKHSIADAKAAVNEKTTPLREDALASADENTGKASDLSAAADEARGVAAERTDTAKRLLTGRDRIEGRLENAPDDMPMGDLQRLRGQAGGLDRVGGEAAAAGVDAGQAARTAEDELARMHAAGIKPIDIQGMADKVSALADAPQNVGDYTRRSTLERVAAEMRRVAGAVGNHAGALYDLQKSGIDTIAKNMMNEGGLKSATAGVLSDVRKIVNQAINDAGGADKWKTYLEAHREGMTPIDQQRIAAGLARESDAGFVKAARGDNPELVQKLTGEKKRFDLAHEMSENAGPGAKNLIDRIRQTADTIEQRDSIVAGAKDEDAAMQARHAQEMRDLAKSQQAAKDAQKARHAAQKGAVSDAVAARDEATRDLQRATTAGVKNAQKVEADAMAARHKLRMQELADAQAKELADFREKAGAVDKERGRQVAQGKYLGRQAVDQSGGRLMRGVRDVARLLVGMKGSALADVAGVLSESNISKGMQKALLNAFRSGDGMEALLMRLKPEQRAFMRTRLVTRSVVNNRVVQQVSSQRAQENRNALAN